jgi:predicted metalloprotease with PDZ domain
VRQRARALVKAAKPQLGMRVGFVSKKVKSLCVKGFEGKSCAAYRYGLRKRDVIVSVDGVAIANRTDFNRYVETNVQVRVCVCAYVLTHYVSIDIPHTHTHTHTHTYRCSNACCSKSSGGTRST